MSVLDESASVVVDSVMITTELVVVGSWEIVTDEVVSATLVCDVVPASLVHVEDSDAEMVDDAPFSTYTSCTEACARYKKEETLSPHDNDDVKRVDGQAVDDGLTMWRARRKQERETKNVTLRRFGAAKG
ncbi:hypothetical protein NM208_g9469 [Fusarium decemcellulare]|uniref:Uncharacterized protein n=1 Tax=Fusarium decemcellulare TaxID=57161 RepID=A0ACC1S1J2_9HYPO|nr:hypothetical protein NM208_g9469 [Fusarium decemcellulare]